MKVALAFAGDVKLFAPFEDSDNLFPIAHIVPSDVHIPYGAFVDPVLLSPAVVPWPMYMIVSASFIPFITLELVALVLVNSNVS